MPILCFMIPLPPQTHGRIILFPPFLNFSYFLWKTMEQHHQGIIEWMILIQKMFKYDLRCDFSKHTLSLHAWLMNFNKCSPKLQALFILLGSNHCIFFFSIEDCIDACMPVWTLGSGTVSSSIQKQCGLSFLTSSFCYLYCPGLLCRVIWWSKGLYFSISKRNCVLIPLIILWRFEGFFVHLKREVA